MKNYKLENFLCQPSKLLSAIGGQYPFTIEVLLVALSRIVHDWLMYVAVR